jgi:hypothetical protein
MDFRVKIKPWESCGYPTHNTNTDEQKTNPKTSPKPKQPKT